MEYFQEQGTRTRVSGKRKGIGGTFTCSMRREKSVKEVKRCFLSDVEMVESGLECCVVCRLLSSSSRCEFFDLCDSRSDAEDSLSDLHFLWSSIRVANLHARTTFLVFPVFEAFSACEEGWRMVEARRSKRAGVLKIKGSEDNSWRKWLSVRRFFEEWCWRQDTWWRRRTASSAMSGRRRRRITTMTRRSGLSFVDHEGGIPSAITGMIVGYVALQRVALKGQSIKEPSGEVQVLVRARVSSHVGRYWQPEEESPLPSQSQHRGEDVCHVGKAGVEMKRRKRGFPVKAPPTQSSSRSEDALSKSAASDQESAGPDAERRSVADSTQALVFGEGCATDTAITEMVSSVQRYFGECTVEDIRRVVRNCQGQTGRTKYGMFQQ